MACRSRLAQDLAVLRQETPDVGREPSVSVQIYRPMLDDAARWVLAKKVNLPISRRPDGPWNKSASAVGAHIAQHAADAE